MGVLPLREWTQVPLVKDFLNKYSCFSFDLHVCRLILECEGKKYEKTDPRPSSPVGHFLAKNKVVFIKVSHVNFKVA